ncbi:hypothetical protein PILCRDRAFT_818633 [Piloderma croceum F 1598]|uniref:Membrane-associated proteins in eicosanoid and glutathione metabolism n=1 Tax=Piloderma croceum (strain F 1598) TaxID=765440 RepID=A0A0C3FXM2_PILCF|nr:hypothetical protein PILCRDRAFT_818633 [Piloderma croceum F 1598]
MSSTIVVPQGLSYTSAAVLSTAFVLVWQTRVVSKARSRAGIKYPQAYAENAAVEASREALIFNCAQRAHQNTLETLPIVLITTLITAVKYPLPAAAACAIWGFSRVFYTLGYITGEPKKRSRGFFGYIGIIGLAVGSIYTAGSLLMDGI